ncbi:hypothetical protein XA68_10763 [Ophiocordyceps unilateralis]|uniref:Uncharacterized protein n=1 Tax=Ophiocordyceps unilateralis TaxID=268505 RepID=A0A2A9PGU1_OPHUN|nr:hypothetical protein XA68_10763 [Ophiocordyceps unilateralis]
MATRSDPVASTDVTDGANSKASKDEDDTADGEEEGATGGAGGGDDGVGPSQKPGKSPKRRRKVNHACVYCRRSVSEPDQGKGLAVRTSCAAHRGEAGPKPGAEGREATSLNSYLAWVRDACG